jgi:hypothetical protein
MVFKVDPVQFENYLYLSTPPNHARNGKKNQIGKMMPLSLPTTLHDQQGTRRDLPWAIGHAITTKRKRPKIKEQTII